MCIEGAGGELGGRSLRMAGSEERCNVQRQSEYRRVVCFGTKPDRQGARGWQDYAVQRSAGWFFEPHSRGFELYVSDQSNASPWRRKAGAWPASA